jgi:hypothetical protein
MHYLQIGRAAILAGLVLSTIIEGASGESRHAIWLAVFAAVTAVLPWRQRVRTGAEYLRNYAVGSFLMALVSLALAVRSLAAIGTQRDFFRGVLASVACVGFAYLAARVGLMARGGRDSKPQPNPRSRRFARRSRR